MSSDKKPPPTDEDLEDDYDYVEGDDGDDDDDEEADFVPGDDETDEEEGTIVPLFHGTLSMDHDKHVHWRGEGFNLTSVEAVPWSLLDRTAEPPWAHTTTTTTTNTSTGSNNNNSQGAACCTIQMEGPCDIETGSGNPTHRKMEVTWSFKDPKQHSGRNGDLPIPAGAKKGDDDTDNDDEEENGPSLYYKVYGRQIGTTKGEIIEFQGGYAPNSSSSEVSLVCQVRVVASQPAAAAAALEKPPAAAAARVDDTDDDDEEADEQVDYDELIALHEDASLSVDALRKRYRGEPGPEASAQKKRGKQMPNDDDEDEDYGF
jgi:hypothetical protein